MLAASPGLPLIENFEGVDLNAGFPATTANWSTDEGALLLPESAGLYGAMNRGSTIVTDIGAESDSTVSIALGDMDGDGDLDVVVGNLGQVNRLYLNDGVGDPFDTIPPQPISLAANSTVDVVIADFDRDGNLDVVECNRFNQPLRFFKNNGTAEPFRGVAGEDIALAGVDSAKLVAGDINGDGFPDLVVGNGSEEINRYYLNNGTEKPFAGVVAGRVGVDQHSTTAIALGDVDNDGDLDLVVGNTGEFNRLYLNNGSQSPFGGAVGLLVGVNLGDITDIRLADINGDGLLDVVSGELSRANRYFLHNGTADPYAQAGGDMGLGVTSTYGIAVGDMDNDGDFDVVTANGDFQRDSYNENFGTASLFSFGATVSGVDITLLGMDSRAVEVGDMDGDGDLDVVVGVAGMPNRLYLNAANLNPLSGVSGTDLERSSGPAEMDSRDVLVADVDGDSFDDIIVANVTENLISNGDFETGNFSGWVNVVNGQNRYAINNDGSASSPRRALPAPVSGNYSAFSSRDFFFSTGLTNTLYQNVTIPAGAGVATLSWTHEIENFAAAFSASQRFRVMIQNTAGTTNHAVAFTTTVGDPNSQAASQHSFDLLPWAGQSLRISFVVEGLANHLEVQVDDVEVVVDTASEVYLNLGVLGGGARGYFADALEFNFSAVGLATGDIDKDGDLDLAIARPGTNVAQVLINGGGGVFANPISLPPGYETSLAVAMRDIDSDGDLDVVVAVDGVNRINFNQYNETGGTTTFTSTDRVALTSDSHTTSALAVEDFDGDGDLDVVAGNGDRSGTAVKNRLYLNNGTLNPFGGITGSDITADADATVSLAAGDVDRDGDIDLVAGNYGGVNRLYLNDGSGAPFSALSGGIPIGVNAYDTLDVLLVDFDKDGDLDLITANDGDLAPNVLYLNNGSNDPFAGAGAGIVLNADGINANTAAIGAGDFDRDGDADIVYANGYRKFEVNRFYLALGTPTTFGENSDGLLATMDADQSVDAVTGDFDGDGDQDIIVGNVGQPNRLYLNNGTDDPFEGVTAIDVTAAANATARLLAADIDGDGDVDLIEGNTSQLNRLYLNNGTADPFNGVTGIAIGVVSARTVGLAVADFDCDGDLDLAVADYDPSYVRVYLNNDTGNPFNGVVPNEIGPFIHTVVLPGPLFIDTPDNFVDIAAGDLTLDGFPDWVVGVGGAENKLLENNGAGGLGAPASDIGSATSNTTRLLLVDMDFDNELDIVEAVNGVNQLWLNRGGGVFLNSGTAIGSDSSNTRGIAVVDLDLDGALDVIAANGSGFNPQPDTFYLHRGLASYRAPFQGVSGGTFSDDVFAGAAVVAVDMTRNGLPDVFVANGASGFGVENRLYSRKTYNVRPAIAHSVRVDTETSNITAARLTATQSLPGNTHVDYFLSNNGGAKYFKVESGRQYVFPTAGTDLRWRAELTSLSPRYSPRVDQIDITGPAANVPPVLSDINLTVNEGFSVAIPEARFNAATDDADQDAIRFVRVVTLPVEGTLKLAGAAVAMGQDIQRTALDGLVYQPSTDFHGMDGFQWNVYDGTAFAGAVAEVVVTVNPIADTPSVDPSSTDEDKQTTTGLKVRRNPVDGPEVTHFQITNIRNGTLYQNDGETPIVNGEFITFLQGDQGLKFTPNPNEDSSGFFEVQASVSGDASGLGGGKFIALILIAPQADTPTVTGAITFEDTTTVDGLKIDRNPADGIEVTHFLITEIQNGDLFLQDGVTPVVNGSYITVAQGRLGLRFAPFANSIAAGGFKAQSSLSADGVGLSEDGATAVITVKAVPDAPEVVGASTMEDTQTTSGLTLNRSMDDGLEVTHFRILGITGGALYKTDGVTRIFEGNFITVAEGAAGLKFTPDQDSTSNGSFLVQGALAANVSSVGGPMVAAIITVAAVNDPPVANADFYQVAEGGTVNTDLGELKTVLENDTDVEGDPLTAVLVSGPAHGVGEFVLNEDGSFIYTHDGSETVMDSFTYKANDGVEDGEPTTVTIQIDPVNKPPVVTAPGAQTVNEDEQLVISDVAVSDPDAGVNPVIVTLSVGHGVLGLSSSVNLVLVDGDGADGTLAFTGTTADLTTALQSGIQYRGAQDYVGDDTLTVTVNDQGASGIGPVRTDTKTVAITVEPVNDRPSIVAANPPQSLEDAGAVTVAGWATFVPGPADEAGQTPLGYVVSNLSNPALFSVAPAVDLDGNLSYTAEPDAYGSATFDLTVQDSGGGDDVSTVRTFTLTVQPVNDAPEFTAEVSLSALEDSGAQTVAGWVTAFDPGSLAESAQIPLFYAVNNVQNAGLFQELPAVSATGDLTFTLAADAFGTATFEVKVHDDGGAANGGTSSSDPKVVTLTVAGVNDQPGFAAVDPPASLEDGGEQRVLGWATLLPGAANETDAVAMYEVTGVGDSTLFASAPEVNASGDLVYTTAPDRNGSTTFTVRVQDDGGTDDGGIDLSETQTFTIHVAAVNDAPSLAAADPPASLEDAGPQSVPGWAGGFDPGPVDEAGQTVVEFVVTNVKPDFFSAGPSVSPTGELTYTAAPDAFGQGTFDVQVRDNGGASNGGTDLSEPATFTVTVNGVNDAPDFTAVDPPAVPEDGGAQTVSGWATFDPGAANETEDGVFGYTVEAVGNPDLFAVAPSINPDGDLSYTPAPDATGQSTFDVSVQDDAGTDDGGNDVSMTRTFTITVAPVNDAPSFVATSPEAVLEDAGLQTLAGWVSSVDAGATDEAGQSVIGYVVNNVSNPDLFEQLPAVDLAGVLTFKGAPDAFGQSSFDVVVQDDGGTADGGADTSAPRSFVITVDPVNDEPSFVASDPPAVNEDAAPQAIPGWASFTPGPANESDQAVDSYSLTVTENPGLFAPGGEPAVSAAGELTYTLATDANGSATFEVAVRDDGGDTVMGDDDLSPTQQFTLTVRAVNDAPSIVASDPPPVAEDSGAQSVSGWMQMFVPGPADEDGQSALAYTIGNVSDPSLFSVMPSLDLSGNLTYTPAANAHGSATFDVTVRDDGGVADGGQDTSVAQAFTITVTEVNDQPDFVAQDPPAVMEDAGPQSIPGWATFDPGPNEDGQTVDQYIVTPPTDALFSAGPSISADGELTYTPAANAHGTFEFTVAVRDTGGSGGDHVDTSPARMFSITVNSVNDAPAFTSPGSVELDEDGSLEITGMAVSDADSGDNVLLVSLSVAHGALAFLDDSGVTVTDGDGTDGTLAFSAGQAEATAVLQAGVTYTPAADFNGSDSLMLRADDQGSDGPDGAKVGMASVAILVNPIADTPAVTDASTDEDVQTISGLTITRNSNDGAETTHLKISAIMGGTLFHNDGVTPIAEGSFIPADSGLGGLRFTPALNSTEDGSFTVQASVSDDDAGLGGDPVVANIVVQSVNDPPMISLPGAASVLEDGSTVISGIEVTDADAGDNPLAATLSVEHGAIRLTETAGLTFTPADGNDTGAATLTFTGSQSAITDAFKSSILYSPTPDYAGNDVLTLTVSDQGHSGGDPKTVTAMLSILVTGQNDRPTTVGIPGFSVTLNSGDTVIDLQKAFSDVEDSVPDLLFLVTANSNPGLFDGTPIDAAAGTLTLDYAQDKPGSSIITVQCQDTEGLSVEATFRVVVVDIQESRIVANDGAATDWFGWAVAIDGDLMVVGAHRDDDAGAESGSAYIYERELGAVDRWKLVTKIVAADAEAGDEFGRSVGISGDTVVVGANGEDADGANAGAAYVFQRDQGGEGAWGQVAKLGASTAAAGDRFGWSVAISGDTVVVGAYLDDDNVAEGGAAFVFERDLGGANAWGQAARLLPADGGVNALFGSSVAISGDQVLVGQPLDDVSGTDSGSAYVFSRNQGGADQWGQAAKLLAAAGAVGDWFGWSVSIDGSIAVVGAPRHDLTDRSNAGSAHVFLQNHGGTGQWGEAAMLTAADLDTSDAFGASVSVSGDSVLVGARGDDDKGDASGSVHLFGRNHGGPDAWGRAVKLTAEDGEIGDAFGYSVAINADSLVVGAPNDDAEETDSGSARAFRIGSSVDLYRATHFSVEDLADPTKEATVWGDLADPDGDGLTNFFEFVAGLDPTDMASSFEFRIEGVPGQPTRRKLVFGPIVAGRTYHVHVNTNLGSGAYVPLTDALVEDDAGIRTVTDLNATGFRVYRVEISVP